MKKVAATKGQRVRRTNFFRLGTTDRWGFSSCCRLAVANFYGCLLKRLTLTTASPLKLLSRLPGSCVFPGISAKLVRKCEITGIFHRCKIFLKKFANFCKREEEYESNAEMRTIQLSDRIDVGILVLLSLKRNLQPRVYNRTM